MTDMTYATPLAYFPGHDPDVWCFHYSGIKCTTAFDYTNVNANLDALVEALENGTPRPVICAESTVLSIVMDPDERERLHRVIAVSRIVNTECGGCDAHMDIPGGWYCADCAYDEAYADLECERNCHRCSRCD